MSAGQTYSYVGFNDSDVVFDGTSYLYEINGYNPSGSDLFIFFHVVNGPPPGPGFAFVKNVLAVPAGAEFSWCPSQPVLFETRTRFDISSTGDEFTASTEEFFVYAVGREQ